MQGAQSCRELDSLDVGDNPIASLNPLGDNEEEGCIIGNPFEIGRGVNRARTAPPLPTIVMDENSTTAGSLTTESAMGTPGMGKAGVWPQEGGAWGNGLGGGGGAPDLRGAGAWGKSSVEAGLDRTQVDASLGLGWGMFGADDKQPTGQSAAGLPLPLSTNGRPLLGGSVLNSQAGMPQGGGQQHPQALLFMQQQQMLQQMQQQPRAGQNPQQQQQQIQQLAQLNAVQQQLLQQQLRDNSPSPTAQTKPATGYPQVPSSNSLYNSHSGTSSGQVSPSAQPQRAPKNTANSKGQKQPFNQPHQPLDQFGGRNQNQNQNQNQTQRGGKGGYQQNNGGANQNGGGKGRKRETGSHSPSSDQDGAQQRGGKGDGKRGGGGRKGGVKWDLSDFVGSVVERSKDQDGSRLIQKKLELAGTIGGEQGKRQLGLIFDELLPDALSLMTDVFGNYVIQKLLDFGSDNHRKTLCQVMGGHVVELTMQTYGCRVVQKALDSVPLMLQKQLIDELRGNVPNCVVDQNGNHVIQKCIEVVPNESAFIIQAFQGFIPTLATHPYGCRVIQKILEHAKRNPGSPLEKACHPVISEIVGLVEMLMMNQNGNYVVQHVMANTAKHYSQQIVDNLIPSYGRLSRDKFASNVAEKVYASATQEKRRQIIMEIVQTPPNGGDCLLVLMMKDQFGNYVIQKMLDFNDSCTTLLIQQIKPHYHILQRLNYGKHIINKIARIEGNTNGVVRA